MTTDPMATSRRGQLSDRFGENVEFHRPHFGAAAGGETLGRSRDPALFQLELSRIQPDADQVRKWGKSADDPDIQKLAESVAREGVLQPLNVRYVAERDCYEIIAGERRYQAARLAKLERVPVRVSNVDDQEARRLQIIENIHRKDLSPVELGAALLDYLERGETLEGIGRLIHKTKSYVTKLTGVAKNLSPEAREIAVSSPDKFTTAHLYEVSQLPADQQAAVLREIAEKGLTRAELVAHTAAAKEAAKRDRGETRGRTARGARPFAKVLRTASGATVTVRFRKSRATTEEVTSALQEALQAARKAAA